VDADARQADEQLRAFIGELLIGGLRLRAFGVELLLLGLVLAIAGNVWET
jgi:hypothetical protein